MKPLINMTLIITVKLFVTTAPLAQVHTLVILVKIGVIESASAKNTSCMYKCIAPMGIEDV